MNFISFDSIKVPIKYGLGVAFIFSILINILHIINPGEIQTGQWASYVSVLLVWMGIYLGMIEKEKLDQDVKMNYLRELKTALLITVVAAFMMGFFMFVYCEYINPELVDIIAEKSKEEMREKGMSVPEINHALKPVYYHYRTKTQVKNQVEIGIVGGFIFCLAAPIIRRTFRNNRTYKSDNSF